jgi:hypothetical protein
MEINTKTAKVIIGFDYPLKNVQISPIVIVESYKKKKEYE